MMPWFLDPPTPHAAYWDTPWFALDFETSNKEKGSALVPENRVVLCAVHEAGETRLGEARDLVPARGLLVAHNAKFELSWLNRLGVDTSQILVWDTMLSEFCLAGNRRWPLDLGSVCRRYGLPAKEPVIDSLMAGGVCPSEMPAHLLRARVIRDVETTGTLFQRQRERMTESGLLNVLFTRCALVPILAEIEATGLFIDKAAASKETRRVLAELRACEAKLAIQTGGINLRSTAQVAHFVYGKLGFAELTDRRGNPKRNAPTKQFPHGLPRVDSDTLDKLVASTPEQREFVRMRGEFGDWNARYTKTLQFLEAVAREHNGLMYGRFNQTVVQTHRLSSSGRKIPIMNPETGKVEEKGIQFQNIPQEYKALFTARDKDYVYVEIDGAKLEFVVAAFLGQDKQAARDIVTGEDIHRYTASVINDIPESQVTKKQRTAAKPFTFGPLFGKTTGTKREVAYYEAFKKKYHEITATQDKWISTVLATKELKTVSGLKFYWPGAKVSGNSNYVEFSTNIRNYSIQSLATAEIIPASLILLYWAVKSLNLRVLFVNTVHDSVCLEVHTDDVDKVRELAEEAFLEGTYAYLRQVYDIDFNVPLGVAFTAGSHWGKGEEISVSRPNPNCPPLIAAPNGVK